MTLATVEHRKLVEVAEQAGGQRIEEALLDSGFSKEGSTWIKIALPMIANAQDIAVEVERVGLQNAEARALSDRIASYLQSGTASPGGSTEVLARLERVLWPAKIMDLALPCYIVPIRPHWAEHLFDIELAGATLFGANPKLAMNSENAYYRAAHPAVLTAPARIMWYVSQDSAYQGTMATRACSYLDDVVVARPKEAFRRFQRLGVYTWRDVFEVAGNDLTKEVMAFRFSKTELLRQPVTWDRLQEVLRRHSGKGSQFQSPIRITESCFLELYQLGMNGA